MAPTRRRAAVERTTRPQTRRPLTAEFLAERYVCEGLSAGKIAAELGCSSQMVRDRLRAFGIPLRPRGSYPPSGVERPTAERLGQLYVEEGKTLAEVGAIVGYSPAGVARLLRAHGIAARRRHGRPLPDDERLSQERLAHLYEADGLSVAEIARQLGTTEDRVSLRLRRYGIALRPARPGSLDWGLLQELYGDRELAVKEIAARLGCSMAHVRRELRRHRIPPRRARRALPPGLVPITKELLEDLYVRRRLTLAEVAEQVGGSQGRVSDALRHFGIPARPRGSRRLPGHEPLTKELLTELYVVQGLGSVTIARRLGGHPSRILKALRRFGIPTRAEAGGGARRLICDPAQLRRWYVEERLSMDAVAERLGVTTNQVRLALRRHRIRRPLTGSPPSPAPPRPVLEDLYAHQRLPMAAIGRQFGSAPRSVRRWLDQAGIPVAPRTTRASRRVLPEGVLEEMYVREGLTAREVAQELDTSQHTVLRALHDYGLPVRPGGSPSRRPRHSIELLAALYADPEIDRILRRDEVPRRPEPGQLAERFPSPVAITPGLLSALYGDVGLSAYHIELLTGQPAEQILDALHAAGIAVRHGSVSPWRQRLRSENL